jgi:hypothetical protein
MSEDHKKPTRYEIRKRRRLKELRHLLAMESINPDDAKRFLHGNKCYGRTTPSLPNIVMRVPTWDV